MAALRYSESYTLEEELRRIGKLCQGAGVPSYQEPELSTTDGLEAGGSRVRRHLCIHAPWLLAFHDLADLLKTSIACCRQGVMRSGSGILDLRIYHESAARMNPGLENWR